MFQQFESLQKVSKENVDTALKSFGAVSKGVQAIAVEVTDYSKRSVEQNSAVVEKLFSAKSLDKAFEIQSDFLKSAYEGLVAQSTKLGELYTSLAKEAYKPVEGALAKAAPAGK
jgi:phasin family protein